MADFATLTLGADTRGLEKAVDPLKKLAREGEKTEKTIVRGAGKMSGAMKNSAKSMVSSLKAVAGGLALAATASASFSKALTFNSALAETSTLINGTAEEMQFLSDQARGLAKAYGGNATGQIKAFYQAISAGAEDVAAASTIVEQANKLALGGVTDVATGVDALTTAIGAYGAEALSAQQISDALFTGMAGGKTTIAELSNSLGQVVPLTAQLGVSFDEVTAAISAITTQGKSTSEAATGIKALMEAIIRAGDASSGSGKFAKSIGLNFSEAALKGNKLRGVLNDLIIATGGSKQEILKLVGSSEALSAVMALTGRGGEKFAKIMGDMANKTGATEKAVAKMAESMSQRWNVILARGADVALVFGTALLNVIVPALEAVTTGAGLVIDNIDILASALTGIAVASLPKLVPMFVGLAGAFMSTAAASGVLTAALGILRGALAFIGGPIGLLVAGGAAVASYFAIFREGATDASDAAGTAAASFDNLGVASTSLNKNLENVVNGLRTTEEALRQVSQTETLIEQERLTREYQQAVQDLGQELIGVTQLSFGDMDQILGQELGQSIQGSRAQLEQLIATLDQIGVANPHLRETITNLINATRNADSLGGSIERTNALMNFLQNKATDADRAVLGIANSARSAEGAVRGIAGGFDPAIAQAKNLLGVVGGILQQASRIPGALGATAKATQASGGILGSLIGNVESNPAVKSAVSKISAMFKQATAGNLKESDVFVAPVTGGGGGGGGGAAAAEEVNSVDSVTEALKRQIEAIGQTDEARQLSQELQKAGVSIYSEEGQQIADLVGQLHRLKTKQEEIDSVTQKVTGAFRDAFVGFVSGAMSAKQAAAQLLASLAKIAFNKAFDALIGGGSGSSGESGGDGGGGFFGKIISGLIGKRAVGGPVKAGVPYEVNENTQNSEVVVPSQSGAVLTVPQAQTAMAKAASGTQGAAPQQAQNVTLTPNFILELDADAVGDKWSSSPSGERAMRKQVAVLNYA